MGGVIRIGTRASRLAQAQTALVVAGLTDAHPDLRLELVPITTSGDRTQATDAPGPNWGSGVFVKELEAALLREDIDVAVHSLKDLPPVISTDLALAAVPARADPLDVLVTRDGRGLGDLEPGARVGTTSARRSAFLRAVRDDLRFLPVRGNVETRLRKLEDGQYEALVLARAGLDRLELERVPCVTLEPDLLPPAPGQGALGLQTRAGDRRVFELLEPLHDPATAAAIRAERRLMLLLDGGCRLPVGALGLARPEGKLELLGGLVADDGSITIDRLEGELAAPEAVADQLASRLRHGVPA